MDRTVSIVDYIRQQVAAMTDQDIAEALLIIARAQGDYDGGAMYGLWCDNRGSCCKLPDDDFYCTDEMQIECVLRYLHGPYMACANCGFEIFGRCHCEKSQWAGCYVRKDNYCGQFISEFEVRKNEDRC